MEENKSKNCNGTDIKKSHKIKELPSQEYLKMRFDYNPELGDFIWKENDDFKYSINYKLVGKSAGTINKTTGYKDITVDYNRYSVHRLIWKLYYGEDPKGIIDHINGNKIDNRISNLRDSTMRLNNHNRVSTKNSTSKYIGVSFSNKDKKWISQITDKGNHVLLGRFNTEEEAALTYVLEKIKILGEDIYFERKSNIEELEYLKQRVEDIKTNENNLTDTKNSTGYTGVVPLVNGKFNSFYIHEGKRMYVGVYDTPEEASYNRELKIKEAVGEEEYFNSGRTKFFEDIRSKVEEVLKIRKTKSRVMMDRNTSGYLGVSACKGSDKWKFGIQYKRKYYGSKYYNTKEEAAYGRELKYRELIGEELYNNSDRYILLKNLEEKVKFIKSM